MIIPGIRFLRVFVTAACIACLCAGCVSALAVTTQAEQVRPGEQVTVELRDIPDDAVFSLRIMGTFPVTPGGEFSFEAQDFQMPFSLQESQIRATLMNTDTNIFAVKRGDVEVRKTGRSQGGSYSVAETYNLSAGTYTFLKMGGTALPDAATVTANLELTGKKTGPDDGTIAFTIQGIPSGTVDVTASVDGSPVLQRTVTVLPAAATYPTPTSGGSGTSGGGGGGGGGGGAVAATATTTTIVPATNVTTVIPAANTTAAQNGTPTTTAPVTSIPASEQTTIPATPAGTPTKSAMSVLPLVGLAIAAVFLANRTRK